jgi:hypothetical protein
MPEVTRSEPDSGEWKALVETTKPTVRPGKQPDSEEPPREP